MPKERTEEEILSRAPIAVRLGGQEYKVPVLSILKARAWREKLIASAKEISQSLFAQTTGHDQGFFAGLGAAFIGFPDKLAEMIFDYDPSLPRDQILESATDEELAHAFSQIVAVAFPFQRQISAMKSILPM